MYFTPGHVLRKEPLCIFQVDVEAVQNLEHLEGSLVTVFGELCILHESSYVMATVSIAVTCLPLSYVRY